ncbi:MAG: acyl-CoA synthetase [Desulfarculus sp.]|jgi:fatty-acyl-CoA synthase|nr:MAG: acyl-CoA synthetase [Desulfarculus sp.]
MVQRAKIATLVDVEAFERIPIDERLPYTNTYEMIEQGVKLAPEADALCFIPAAERYQYPVRISYGELFAQITRSANLFHDLGITPGKVVSYLLPNAPQAHFVLWGAQAAGIANPVNPMLEPSVIADICRQADTQVLVAWGEDPDSDIWQKVMAIRGQLPRLKALIRVNGPSDQKEDIYGFEDILGRYNPDALDSKRVFDPDDTASLFHTGGTTGTPKLAPSKHYNVATMAFMIACSIEVDAGETILSGLPLFHVNATTFNGSWPFSIGARVVILGPQGFRDRAMIAKFPQIVEHYRAVTFSSVPTVLSALLDTDMEGADISSLRYALCGAAPLSVELFRRFEQKTGMKIIEGYGLTEGNCVTSLNPSFGERKIGSIGMRIPYHYIQTLIVDEKGDFVRDAEVDEIGALCIKGPNVFPGYLDESHNQGTRPLPGWFNTGDLARRDGDGYFWLTGRKKDLIIRGGHNIDPSVIEDALHALPGVKAAAAVGRPDPHSGELPIAYVELEAGAGITADKILDSAKKSIGERAAVPKEVIILDHIPLTAVGKIYKPALRWAAIKRVYEDELQPLAGVVRSLTVEVGEDKVHGCLATIKITTSPGADLEVIQSRVAEALGRYTTMYRVEFI